MKPLRHKFAACILLAFVLAGSLCTQGCLGMMSQPEIAAVVGDQQIEESAVTEYIEGFRSRDEQCETDAGWAQFMTSHGYTAESIRTYVLETVFIPQAVLDVACSEMGIVISDEELDQVVAEDKAYYEEHYGPDAWGSALSSYGYDEASWRTHEEYRLLKERVLEQIVGDATPNRSQVEAYIVDHAADYNGRHSYYLQFANESEADLAYAALTEDGNGNLTLDDLAAEAVNVALLPSTGAWPQAKNGSWSSFPDTADDLSGAYLTAVNQLEVGQLSEPVPLGDGTYALILCDGVFNIDPESPFINFSTIPDEITERFQADAVAFFEEGLYQVWLNERKAEIEITINDMPDNLPYDVNIAVTPQGTE